MLNKRISLALAIFIAVCAQGWVSNANAESTTTNIHYALLDEKGQAVLPEVSTICWASEDGLFFLGDGSKPSLFHWQFGQKQVKLISETPLATMGRWKTLGQERVDYPRDESIIYSLTDGLYGLILETGEIKRYSIQSDEWEYVATLLTGDRTSNDLDIDTIKDAVRDEAYMYFLMNSPERTDLLRVDLSTGAYKSIPDTYFTQIEPYTPGKLLVTLDGSIRVYDVDTHTLGEALVSMDPLSTAFSYDQVGVYLYFVRDSDIYRKGKDQREELICVTDVRSENPSENGDAPDVYGNVPVSFLLPLPNGSLAYHTARLKHERSRGNPDSFLYIVHPEPIIGAVQTLHLRSDSSAEGAFYQLTHPNVRVEYCITDYDNTQINAHLPDVFETTAASTLIYFPPAPEPMDLSGSSIIRETVSKYDPKVLEAICEREKILGLPSSVSLNMLDYDKEKWDSIGLPNPPRTVDELFDLIEMWDMQYAAQYPEQSLFGNGAFFDSRCGVWVAVTDAYANEYASLNAPVNFDTEEYRLLLQRIIDMPDLEYSEWNALLRFFSAFYALDYRFTDLDWKDGYTEYTSIPPLALSETQPVRVRSSLHYFCVAKDAQCPELALDYVSFLTEFQSQYQPEIVFMMTGGKTQLSGIDASNASFQTLPWVGMISEGLWVLPDKTPGGFIGKESLAFYRSIFPSLDFHIYGVNPINTLDMPDMRLPWPTDYPDGDLVCTVDELIQEMNKRSERNFLAKQTQHP